MYIMYLYLYVSGIINGILFILNLLDLFLKIINILIV